MNSTEKVVVLTGPTGSGKSKSLFSLPENPPIELINADSRQVYQKLSIGTDIPTKEELERYPSHLYGFLDPKERYSAGNFLKDVTRLIPEILNRGNTPVIVGGTFFYIKTMYDGLIEEPEISIELQQKIEQMPLGKVRDRLREVDPANFEKIKEGDDYRNRRALLIFEASGRPYSSFQKKSGLYNHYQFESFYIDMPREMLYERINQRVKMMFQNGLLAEIQGLLDEGFSPELPGLLTIGYKEVLDIFTETGIQPGRFTPELAQKATALISLHSRRYAKRQLTWFRHEKRLKTIDHTQTLSLLSDIIQNTPVKKEKGS